MSASAFLMFCCFCSKELPAATAAFKLSKTACEYLSEWILKCPLIAIAILERSSAARNSGFVPRSGIP